MKILKFCLRCRRAFIGPKSEGSQYCPDCAIDNLTNVIFNPDDPRIAPEFN